MRATKQKEKEEVGGEEEVSRGARGQLIVSGNVFHLHVYTVNSGEQGGGAGGVHGTPFTAAIPIRAGDCCAPADRAGEERKKGQRERVQLCVIFFK